MNRAEFEAWKNHTSVSNNVWILDPIHNGVNSSDYLFHRGGTNGQYIVVEDGEITIGWYAGAIPHIGEAEFMREYSNEFENNLEAFKILQTKLGVDISCYQLTI